MKFNLKQKIDATENEMTIDLRVLVVAAAVATILFAGKPDLVDVAARYIHGATVKNTFIVPAK